MDALKLDVPAVDEVSNSSAMPLIFSFFESNIGFLYLSLQPRLSFIKAMFVPYLIVCADF